MSAFKVFQKELIEEQRGLLDHRDGYCQNWNVTSNWMKELDNVNFAEI